MLLVCVCVRVCVHAHMCVHALRIVSKDFLFYFYKYFNCYSIK